MEGKPTLTKVEIDGNDVTTYLSNWTLTSSSGGDFIKAIRLSFSKSLGNIINISSNNLISKEIIVYRGVTSATEYTIFRGIIVNQINYGGLLEIHANDKLYLSVKRTITYSFDKDIDTEAGIISEIFKTIVNNYTDLTADSLSVQNTGNIMTINKFVCKSEKVYDKLKLLADTISWIFYYDPIDDKVHFEPKGYKSNSTVLETGVNIVETPEWNNNESALYNKIRVDGAVQQAQTVINGQIGVTSGFSTNSIQLAYIPISTRVLCDSSNPPTTEKVFGVPNSTKEYDYYIDKTKKQIIWNTSKFTPNSNDYVQVTYTYMAPVPISINDTDSIAKYGIKEITLSKPQLKDVIDAKLFAIQYLTDHKNPILSTELKVTNVKDLDIGQEVKIIDNINGINDYFKITQIKKTYPYYYDTISVTSDILDESDYMVEINQRIIQLEKDSSDDLSSLIEVKLLNNDLIYENRYLKITKKSLTGSFETTNLFLENSEKEYIELFYDTEFKNINTTANWDTTNKEITFISGDVAESEYFAYDINNTDNNVYKSVNIILTGNGLNNLSFYIGEFDNVSDIFTEITLSGTDTNKTGSLSLNNINKYGIKFKITANDVATLEIIKIIYNK